MLDALIVTAIVIGVFELIRMFCPSWLKPIFARLGQVVYLLPHFMQKPTYLRLKQELILAAQKMNPIVGYPLLIFIELNLDAEFKKGGLRQVDKALKERTDGFKDWVKASERSLASWMRENPE